MLIPLWSGSASDVGHFKLILRVDTLLWLVGIFMTSVCREYWQFLLAQGMYIGVANGFLFVPTMSVVSTYFDPSRRSLAIGLIKVAQMTIGEGTFACSLHDLHINQHASCAAAREMSYETIDPYILKFKHCTFIFAPIFYIYCPCLVSLT